MIASTNDLLDPSYANSLDRLGQIIQKLNEHQDFERKKLPGLTDLLDKFLDHHNTESAFTISPEDYVRDFLKVFKDSKTDGTYSNILNKYEDDERDRIKRFVEEGKSFEDCGRDFDIPLSIGAREELPNLELPHKVIANTFGHIEQALLRVVNHIHIYDDADKKSQVMVYVDEKWENWGRTVTSKPKFTCVPQTSFGVQQIVRYAKKHDMNVRASGYRHSWAPIFGKNGQIIISTLGQARATVLPNIESIASSKYYEPRTELNSIEFAKAPVRGQPRLIRVGTAVTNEQFRRWCTSQSIDEQSTLPLNVIMVEITLGGSNGPICHGAGRAHSTLSDLVHAIEYVDANGNIQKINKGEDPELMASASGCFGLLGIVTHITLTLDPMSYAILTPQKLPIMKAIPPPPGLGQKDIPEALWISMTPEEQQAAQTEFEKHVRDDFYSEWFWFPYTSKVWVNCWNKTDDPKGVEEYPSKIDVFGQFIQTVFMQIIQHSQAVLDLQEILPFAQTTLISTFALFVLPETTALSPPVKTQLPNALHFRRAIQNVRVRDTEIEIPLQPVHGKLCDAKFDDEIDFTTIQTAFWSAVLTAYKYTSTCPQRMPLEMRITGPSSVTLAPYNGFKLGACSIEVLTLEMMHEIWKPYAQEVVGNWMNLKDKDGEYLNSRPHWAKEWYGLNVRGRPMTEYLKESYADAIEVFRRDLETIGKRQGWTMKEMRERFSNDLFEDVFFGSKVNGLK